MKCEMKALSAIFLARCTKKYRYTKKMAHLSGICGIIKIHQFPRLVTFICIDGLKLHPYLSHYCAMLPNIKDHIQLLRSTACVTLLRSLGGAPTSNSHALNPLVINVLLTC